MNHPRDITTSQFDHAGHTCVAVHLAGSPIFMAMHKSGIWETQRVSQSPLSPSTIDELTQALGQAIIDTGLVSCALPGGAPPEPTASDVALALLLGSAQTMDARHPVAKCANCGGPLANLVVIHDAHLCLKCRQAEPRWDS